MGRRREVAFSMLTSFQDKRGKGLPTMHYNPRKAALHQFSYVCATHTKLFLFYKRNCATLLRFNNYTKKIPDPERVGSHIKKWKSGLCRLNFHNKIFYLLMCILEADLHFPEEGYWETFCLFYSSIIVSLLTLLCTYLRWYPLKKEPQ